MRFDVMIISGSSTLSAYRYVAGGVLQPDNPIAGNKTAYCANFIIFIINLKFMQEVMISLQFSADHAHSLMLKKLDRYQIVTRKFFLHERRRSK